MMKVVDIDFDKISLDEKSCKTQKNILIYDIPYKTFMDATPLRIWFEKIDRFIKIYDGIRYLVLFDSRRYDVVFDKIRYPVSKKVVLQILLAIFL